MEHRRHDAGGEHPPVNSYGTDDPAKQAQIEAARAAASRERKRDRARLEQMVATGIDPDEAEAVIEFEDTHGQKRYEQTGTEPEIEHQPRYQPKIYVACLAAYNNGRLHGVWLDAARDVHEVQADVHAMLARSPIPGAEEYAIHDYENFAGYRVAEYSTLSTVCRVATGIEAHGEAFAAYVDWVGLHDLDALEHFDDHYIGTYRSMAEWAKQIAADLDWPQQIQQKLDEDLAQYVEIDYERWAHDATHWWHVVDGDDGIHVFAP